MKLRDLFEATISFADPDREPGAVDREGAARDALAKRERASTGAWEDLIEKMSGQITHHQKPGERSISGRSPSIYAKLPEGFKIDMWRSDVLLTAPKISHMKIARHFRLSGKSMVSTYMGQISCILAKVMLTNTSTQSILDTTRV